MVEKLHRVALLDLQRANNEAVATFANKKKKNRGSFIVEKTNFGIFTKEDETKRLHFII